MKDANEIDTSQAKNISSLRDFYLLGYWLFYQYPVYTGQTRRDNISAESILQDGKDISEDSLK